MASELAKTFTDSVKEASAGLGKQLQRSFTSYTDSWLGCLASALSSGQDTVKHDAFSSLGGRLGPTQLNALIAEDPAQPPTLEALLKKSFDKAKDDLERAASRAVANAIADLQETVLEACRNEDSKLLWSTMRPDDPLLLRAATSALLPHHHHVLAGAPFPGKPAYTSYAPQAHGSEAAALLPLAPLSLELPPLPASMAASVAQQQQQQPLPPQPTLAHPPSHAAPYDPFGGLRVPHQPAPSYQPLPLPLARIADTATATASSPAPAPASVPSSSPSSASSSSADPRRRGLAAVAGGGGAVPAKPAPAPPPPPTTTSASSSAHPSGSVARTEETPGQQGRGRSRSWSRRAAPSLVGGAASSVGSTAGATKGCGQPVDWRDVNTISAGGGAIASPPAPVGRVGPNAAAKGSPPSGTGSGAGSSGPKARSSRSRSRSPSRSGVRGRGGEREREWDSDHHEGTNRGGRAASSSGAGSRAADDSVHCLRDHRVDRDGDLWLQLENSSGVTLWRKIRQAHDLPPRDKVMTQWLADRAAAINRNLDVAGVSPIAISVAGAVVAVGWDRLGRATNPDAARSEPGKEGAPVGRAAPYLNPLLPEQAAKKPRPAYLNPVRSEPRAAEGAHPTDTATLGGGSRQQQAAGEAGSSSSSSNVADGVGAHGGADRRAEAAAPTGPSPAAPLPAASAAPPTLGSAASAAAGEGASGAPVAVAGKLGFMHPARAAVLVGSLPSHADSAPAPAVPAASSSGTSAFEATGISSAVHAPPSSQPLLPLPPQTFGHPASPPGGVTAASSAPHDAPSSTAGAGALRASMTRGDPAPATPAPASAPSSASSGASSAPSSASGAVYSTSTGLPLAPPSNPTDLVHYGRMEFLAHRVCPDPELARSAAPALACLELLFRWKTEHDRDQGPRAPGHPDLTPLPCHCPRWISVRYVPANGGFAVARMYLKPRVEEVNRALREWDAGEHAAMRAAGTARHAVAEGLRVSSNGSLLWPRLPLIEDHAPPALVVSLHDGAGSSILGPGSSSSAPLPAASSVRIINTGSGRSVTISGAGPVAQGPTASEGGGSSQEPEGGGRPFSATFSAASSLIRGGTREVVVDTSSVALSRSASRSPSPVQAMMDARYEKGLIKQLIGHRLDPHGTGVLQYKVSFVRGGEAWLSSGDRDSLKTIAVTNRAQVYYNAHLESLASLLGVPDAVVLNARGGALVATNHGNGQRGGPAAGRGKSRRNDEESIGDGNEAASVVSARPGKRQRVGPSSTSPANTSTGIPVNKEVVGFDGWRVCAI